MPAHGVPCRHIQTRYYDRAGNPKVASTTRGATPSTSDTACVPPQILSMRPSDFAATSAAASDAILAEAAFAACLSRLAYRRALVV